MSVLLQASDTLKRELNRLRGLQIAAEALERIGSLEQAEEDAQRKHAEIQGKVFQITHEMETLEADLTARRGKFDEYLKEAQGKVDAVLQKADKAAADVVANAKAEAGTIREAAIRDSDKTMADAMTRRDIALAHEREANEASKTAETCRKVAEAELGGLRVKIDLARAEITRMLG